VTEFNGEWEVRRVSGLLPPLLGVRKRIAGAHGQTRVAGLAVSFDVVGRELRYRGVFSGMVDELAPDGAGWLGVTRYRGRRLGRFRMDPLRPSAARD
jgi:hypothetical protein